MSRGRVNAALTMLRYRLAMGSGDWERRVARGVVTAARMLAAMAALCFAHIAAAQTVTTYVNDTNGTINSTTTCASPLVRTFAVGTSFVVADVDLGVFATHSYRGDLRITLQGPDGTRVQVVNGDTNDISGDNFNVRLNNSGTQVVNTDSGNGTHSTAAPPPFANNFIPDSSLAAFNGKNSTGTWRLEICDRYPQADNGTFRHAELYLTAAPAAYADLSLTKSVSSGSPAIGATVTYTLQLTNAAGSPTTATNVRVTDLLPMGTTYASHNGVGTYVPLTGQWTVPSISPGQTRTLTIQAVVTAMPTATVTNTAEVSASSIADLDSAPGNGATGEDDYASASFTVAGSRSAGTPPALNCPAGSTLFDWDARNWAAGTLANSYAVTRIGTVGFTVSASGTWVTDGNYGGMSPALSDANSGGLSGNQDSLHQYLDFSNRSQTATTVITLPTAALGVQFTVFDIDYAGGDFADLLTVTGSYQGSAVMPVLTNGVANYVIGNRAVGDGLSGNNSGDGNVVVTFTQPVDTITIVYGNADTAPADPDGQAIAIHDLNFCNPATSLSVTKTSLVASDPVSGTANPKAIPGALIRYAIAVANTGASAADNGSIVVTDKVPPATKMCLNDIGGGPVLFADGSPSSNLAYSFAGLASTTDGLRFSNNGGAAWTYQPVLDAQGCDTAITDFQVRPTGSFHGGGRFRIEVLFLVE